MGFAVASLAYTGIRQARQIADEQKKMQEKGMIQSREIADRQMSFEHMSKQTALNFSVKGIPIGLAVYGLIKARDGVVYIYKGRCNGIKSSPSKD